eukprot:CAMPEP_0119051136 /NCGR_PEP_ID=MMETSP1177-20130426/72856_1 /TAXON_ID=2985 /ORGANISM="Ochromonas sp, Strain CCMP1899" /LENGTH=814 /DNA_ID=CAMNT_0007030245 /DNA_START=432 /DNA_END=2877 /DNA_ORIENTATION=-
MEAKCAIWSTIISAFNTTINTTVKSTVRRSFIATELTAFNATINEAFNTTIQSTFYNPINAAKFPAIITAFNPTIDATFSNTFNTTQLKPSSTPSQPSSQPSTQPSTKPSTQPSTQPSKPSMQPSSQPSMQPSSQPSTQPSTKPSTQPSSKPSNKPSSKPTSKPSTLAPVVAQKQIYTIAPTIGQKVSYPTLFPTPTPSLLPTQQPNLAYGSVCITISIGTTISQDEWTNANSITAMKEALAISMGVSINAIDINYANQLCQASTEGNRRILVVKSMIIPSVMLSHHNSSTSVYDTNVSIVHIATHRQLQLSQQLQFSVVIQLSANESAESVANTVAATKAQVTTAVVTGTFCNALVGSSKLHNVTTLNTPEGIGAMKAVCNTTNIPIFSTSFIAGTDTQPSSMPSTQPSSEPTKIPTPMEPGLITSSFIGFICIVILIGFLRFFPYFMSLFIEKERKLSGIKYDVLVMINDEQEALLENINHEDIVFFRRTKIEAEDQTLAWMTNVTCIALEKRFEVKFFDKYELYVGSLKGKDNRKNYQDASKSDLLNDGEIEHGRDMLQGMIIRVKLKDNKDDPIWGNCNGEIVNTESVNASNFVSNEFVINDDHLNERMRLAALARTPDRQPSANGLGSVSIDMYLPDLRRRFSNSRSSKCSSADHSDCISDKDILNQRLSIFRFGVESKMSENDDLEVISLPQDDNICDRDDEESEGSSNQFELSDEDQEGQSTIQSREGFYSELERSRNSDASSEIPPWDFPPQYTHRADDREVWEINKSKRINTIGSWRHEIEKEDMSGEDVEDFFSISNSSSSSSS